MRDLQWEDIPLFDPGPEVQSEISTKPSDRPVWSENKAELIARYLRYFVYVTRHGTYIDAFAGPQTDRSERAWTAQLVLDSEPKWLRNFYLFDQSQDQVTLLEDLASRHTDRNVNVHRGNSNRCIPAVLPIGSISEREATFCLLDQRTFECEWRLCRHISKMRPGSVKVEQFYFLANSWMPRSLAAVSTAETEAQVKEWLGCEDWRAFAALDSLQRQEYFVDKFRHELGYRSVRSWPIYGQDAGRGALMYYMIHATDHEAAPKLMSRAYRSAVTSARPVEQLEFLLGHDSRN